MFTFNWLYVAAGLVLLYSFGEECPLAFGAGNQRVLVVRPDRVESAFEINVSRR